MSDNQRRAASAYYIASLTDQELTDFVDEARGITEARELVRHLFSNNTEEN